MIRLLAIFLELIKQFLEGKITPKQFEEQYDVFWKIIPNKQSEARQTG